MLVRFHIRFGSPPLAAEIGLRVGLAQGLGEAEIGNEESKWANQKRNETKREKSII